jgi:hypothetical protein
MDSAAPGIQESMNQQERPQRDESDRLLAVYLRDHFAGSTAGLALVRRCRRNNAGNELGEVLTGVENDIDEDRRALQEIMARLGVTPSTLKSAVGSIAELVGRLKSNGRLFRYSPSSAVVELEGLAAGILTKRNLWRSLRAASPAHATLPTADLDALEERATAQLDRVLAAHERAAARAFGSLEPQPPASEPPT